MVKEMKYINRISKAELLARDTYKNYEYVVLSLGSHPCAYIILDADNKLYGKHYDIINSEYDIDCHGGLTYSEDKLTFLIESDDGLVEDSINDKWVIGWDYGHYGDYVGYLIVEDTGKKWSTMEIIEECKNVINQLIDLEV